MDSRASSYTQPMTGTKQRYVDTAPQIIPAGKSSRVMGDGAKQCVQPGLDQSTLPPTPPEIKKYRKSTIHEPGKIVVHYGRSDDPIPDKVFGVKSVKLESAADLMVGYPTSELMQWRLDRQEDIYASTKREPLGKSFNRGHAHPDGLGTSRPFGVSNGVLEKNLQSQVKELVFPLDTEVMQGDADKSEAHAMYVKTHGDYAPGEQRRRGYDWQAAGLNPDHAVFGQVDNHPYMNGVAKAMNPLTDDSNKASVAIIQKRVEDFKMSNNDELGHVKTLGHGPTAAPDGHIYGVPSRRCQEWGAGRLIKGDYNEEEQAPDPDLGKSLRQGYRNVAEPVDGNRAFGVPTIRTDLPARSARQKSVADNSNYGNEPAAVSLIFPSGGADRGVVEDDYLKPYTKDSLREFYNGAGIYVGEDEFEAAFEHASELDEAGAGMCSLNTFQHVRMYQMSQRMQ
mmetsp:Transcript_28766/g.70933  ORF Transcript_28766/g.70933 Transcript_28766/m.70933 type:complete len:452 (-) Transcript_28766:47-1402(-)